MSVYRREELLEEKKLATDEEQREFFEKATGREYNKNGCSLERMTVDQIFRSSALSYARRQSRMERSLSAHADRIDSFVRSLPSSLCNCTVDNYVMYDEFQGEVLGTLSQYYDSLDERCRIGGNLVLFGDAGTGKDHMCSAMSRKVFEAGWWVRYVHLLDLRKILFDWRENAKDIEDLYDVDVLWISELAHDGDAGSAFYRQQLSDLISHRDGMYKPTWVTCNADSLESVGEFVGGPAMDRLTDRYSLACHFDWDSYRYGERDAKTVSQDG